MAEIGRRVLGSKAWIMMLGLNYKAHDSRTRQPGSGSNEAEGDGRVEVKVRVRVRVSVTLAILGTKSSR